MRQLYPVVPFEPSRNYLINLSNIQKSFLININAEGRISAAYSALLQQSGGDPYAVLFQNRERGGYECRRAKRSRVFFTGRVTVISLIEAAI
jgi:hypothetical protein